MTPPWWLTSHTAAASPWVAQLDRKALVPVKGSNWPKVIVPAPALVGVAPAGRDKADIVATATEAAAAVRHIWISFLVKFPSPLVV
jgi:hypothetical protein